MGEESEGGRWPERRQSLSFFRDSMRALWVISSRTDVSFGSLHVREDSRVRRSEKVKGSKSVLSRNLKM